MIVQGGLMLIYFILFLEGILTFISPCLLPMIPVYLSYIAGSDGSFRRHSTIKNAFGFIFGFTIVFVVLGAFMGTIGVFLTTYSHIVSIIAGIVMILLGLNFMGVLRLPFLNFQSSREMKYNTGGFVQSVLFGIVFSISWTPCVGAFLGSALMMAASTGGILKGIIMLLIYSLGLGIPFMLSALLLDELKTSFDFIKRNYRVISIASGLFLIIIGLLMISGIFGSVLRVLSDL
jgi:cytochrome c-type biogenesis protein